MSKERPILFNGPMVRAILDGRKTITRRIIKPQPAPLPADFCAAYRNGVPGFGFLQGVLCNSHIAVDENVVKKLCPYGKPGDRLWVREAWRVGAWCLFLGIAVEYQADGFHREEWIKCSDGELFFRLVEQSISDAKKRGLDADYLGLFRWTPGNSPCRVRPSIHMPRWASRITLEITCIRVERVQDISQEDALAEGCTMQMLSGFGYASGPSEEEFNFQKAKLTYRLLWESINGPGSWALNPWVWVIEFRRVA